MKIQNYYASYRVARKNQPIQDVEISSTTITMLEVSMPESIVYIFKAKKQFQKKLDTKHKEQYPDFIRTNILKIYTDHQEAQDHANRENEKERKGRELEEL